MMYSYLVLMTKCCLQVCHICNKLNILNLIMMVSFCFLVDKCVSFVELLVCVACTHTLTTQCRGLSSPLRVASDA